MGYRQQARTHDWEAPRKIQLESVIDMSGKPEGFGSRQKFEQWEKDIATRRLQEAGFTVLMWSTVDMTPSRIIFERSVTVKKNDRVSHFYYK